MSTRRSALFDQEVGVLSPPPVSHVAPAITHTAQAELAGVALSVEVGHDSRGSRFVSANAAVTVGDDVAQIQCPASDFELWALGPALLTVLARQQVFALHAATISMDNSAVLLLAHSGTGKSSLARVAQEQGLPRWTDDVALIDCARNPPKLLPDYPQLKLAPTAQVAPATSAQPLRALVLLSRGAPSWQAVAPRAVLSALLSHSIASRLFAPAVLALHLRAMARLAQAVPTYALTMADRPGRPSCALRDALAQLRARL